MVSSQIILILFVGSLLPYSLLDEFLRCEQEMEVSGWQACGVNCIPGGWTERQLQVEWSLRDVISVADFPTSMDTQVAVMTREA